MCLSHFPQSIIRKLMMDEWMMLSHPIEVSLESALNYIVSLGCNLIFLLFLLGLKYRSKEKEISRKETNLQRKKKKKTFTTAEFPWNTVSDTLKTFWVVVPSFSFPIVHGTSNHLKYTKRQETFQLILYNIVFCYYSTKSLIPNVNL